MKKILPVLFLVILFCQFSKADYQSGRIILLNGDTIRCIVYVHSYNVLLGSDKIGYKIEDKRYSIKSAEVSGVQFDNLKFEKFSFNRTRQVQQGPRMVTENYQETIFAIQMKDGKAKLYKYYYLKSNGTTPMYGGGSVSRGSYQDTGYFIKKEGKTTEINWLTFKADCRYVFDDCPVLTEKINNNDFSYKELENLVDFANTNCLEEK